MRQWSDLTRNGAEAELARFIGSQAVRRDALLRNCDVELDWTVDSLGPAWDYVINPASASGLTEEDLWMKLMPAGIKEIGVDRAWLAPQFSAYWANVVSTHIETSWKLGDVLKGVGLSASDIGLNPRTYECSFEGRVESC